MARRARTIGKPRKRTALRKSRLKAENRFNEDHESPSQAKWATMASYGSFVGEYLTSTTSQATS
jgi:hypothetical protein